MTDEERKVLDVLERFVMSGLITKDINQVLKCLADKILGIGIGEQGFVTSHEDVKSVLVMGIKEDDTVTHSVRYGRSEVTLHTDIYATACAEVFVDSHRNDGSKESVSRFSQFLSFIKQNGEWKICGLHASVPVLTEEAIDAYPLKFAEKTLQNLKDRIGEKAYLMEEQYRSAILADTIAFYIVNYTKNIFEKCVCKSDICVYVEPGQCYDEEVQAASPKYVSKEEREIFAKRFSRQNILEAYERGEREISQEYRMLLPDGSYMWAVTIVRMIADIESGDKKGIMYVRDIDKSKREELALKQRATIDGMTRLYNKQSFRELAENWLKSDVNCRNGIFILMDVDNFKSVNDTYGHPVGDQVLIHLAASLKEVFGEIGYVGRFGGDEFCVLLQEKYEKKAVNKMLQNFQSLISHMKLEGGRELAISSSQGIAYCMAGDNFDVVYCNADKALYEAKKNGKAQAAYY